MKLASKQHERDGQLLVVDRKLERAHLVGEDCPTLQYALDHWHDVHGMLQDLYHKLNEDPDSVDSIAFNPKDCAAPLPRAYQWLDGSAYVHHVELARKARGAKMPDNFWKEPIMYQGLSHRFIGPTENIHFPNDSLGIDFEAEIAVITGDVVRGSNKNEVAHQLRLFMLINDISLRNLIPDEVSKGFGFVQSKPPCSASPVAVTPDEFGDHWRENKILLPLKTEFNGEFFGHPNAGLDMVFDFCDLVQHAAKTRSLCAGTIIGSGTVSNVDTKMGSSCLVEKRTIEMLKDGKITTSYMKNGDRVHIEMHNASGQSIFGAIDQELVVQT